MIETEAVFVRRGAELVCVGGMPPRLDRFAQAGIDVHALLAEEH